MNATNRLWIMALAAVVLLSACGGGGGGAAVKVTTTTRPLTPRATLVKAGSTACSQFIEIRETMVKAFLAQHQVTDAAATRDFLVNQLAPTYDSVVGALHRLYLPTEDPSEWAKIMDAVDSDNEAWKLTIDGDPATAINGDPFADVAPRMVAFGLADSAKF